MNAHEPQFESHIATLNRVLGPCRADLLGEGTESAVFEVEKPTGDRFVAKFYSPQAADRLDREVCALRSAPSGVTPRVLAVHRDNGFVLIEHAGQPIRSLALTPSEEMRVCEALMRAFWSRHRCPNIPSGAEKAQDLLTAIGSHWDLIRGQTSLLLRELEGLARRRRSSHTEARAVMCHGDVHPWNVVADAVFGYRLIDPQGVWVEPEYDVAVLLRDVNEPAEYDACLSRIKGVMDVDQGAIRDWWLLERHSTAVYLILRGYSGRAAQMLGKGR